MSSRVSPLTVQQLTGAAERLQRRDQKNSEPEQWLNLVEDTRDRLALHPFIPLPLDGFFHGDGERRRLVGRVRPGDRLIEEALLPILRRVLAPRLLPCVHGFWRRRSTFTAASELKGALSCGHHFIVKLDISSFFPSIDHEILAQRLTALLPEVTVNLIISLASAPIQIGGTLHKQTHGVPPGRPTAPLLSNVFLIPLDESMVDLQQTKSFVYLRYADDILIATASEDVRAVVEAHLIQNLDTLKLKLKDSKTEYLQFNGSPIEYLGHAVDDHAVYQKVSQGRLERLSAAASDTNATELHEEDLDNPSSWPSSRVQTLYITEPGLYLATSQGLIMVKRGTQIVLEVPLRQVDRVLILAGVSISSGLMAACIGAEIPILFFVGRGKAFGSLVSGGMPNPLRLRSQYDLLRDPARRLSLACDIIHAKVEAMRRRLANEQAAASIRDQLSQTLARLREATTPEALRGMEGAATRAYYEGFALRIKVEEFAFKVRSRRPPKDPINSLMSFSYSLIFGEMQTALLAHGLDPHPGVLHELHHNHPALASDLIEPYRPLIADSFVLELVNNRRVNPSSFETQASGGVFMTQNARREVLQSYEAFMSRPAGGAKGVGSPRQLIRAAAQVMLAVVLGEASCLELPLKQADIIQSPYTPTEVKI